MKFLRWVVLLTFNWSILYLIPVFYSFPLFEETWPHLTICFYAFPNRQKCVNILCLPCYNKSLCGFWVPGNSEALLNSLEKILISRNSIRSWYFYLLFDSESVNFVLYSKIIFQQNNYSLSFFSNISISFTFTKIIRLISWWWSIEFSSSISNICQRRSWWWIWIWYWWFSKWRWWSSISYTCWYK